MVIMIHPNRHDQMFRHIKVSYRPINLSIKLPDQHALSPIFLLLSFIDYNDILQNVTFFIAQHFRLS